MTAAKPKGCTGWLSRQGPLGVILLHGTARCPVHDKHTEVPDDPQDGGER